MFTDPVKNLNAFGIGDSMIVADLGAGTGFYSILASVMAPLGKVYAVEIQKDFLTTVKNKAKDRGCKNIECLWGNIEKKGGTLIKDNIVDRVIASNILFQVENKDKFIEEAHRILKKGGHMLLIDWSPDHSASIRSPKGAISKAKAKEMLESKGFVWKRDIDAGAHHYGMILEKK